MDTTQNKITAALRALIAVLVSVAMAATLTPSAAYADTSSTEIVADYNESEDEVADDEIESAASVQTATEDYGADVDKAELWAAGVDDESEVDEVYAEEEVSDEEAGIMLLASSSAVAVAPKKISKKMRYFCKYESSCNYDQGLSSGDGYHAMGYYQFDNRYGLDDFLHAVYNYDSKTYSSLKTIGTTYKWESNRATRKDGKFTAFGNALNKAWHASYAADSTEYSRLQNGWAYQEYYTPVVKSLKAMGISLSGRSSCVKGLVWGMANLFGLGGGATYVKKGEYYGANWFFKKSGIKNSMSDKEFVTTLCNYVVKNVAKRYPSQKIYHKGWQNRYKSEKADCLAYLAAEEKSSTSATTTTTTTATNNKLTTSNASSSNKTTSTKKTYKAGLVTNTKGLRYRNSDGTYAKNAWKTVSGKKYRFSANGYAYNGLAKVGKKYYFFNTADYHMEKSKWKTVSKKKYYFGKDGAAYTGHKIIDKKKYYFNSSGQMKTGWKKWSNGTYSYFNKKDGHQLFGKHKIKGKTYNFGTKGTVKKK